MLHKIKKQILQGSQNGQGSLQKSLLQKSAYGFILLMGCAVLFACTAGKQQEVISQKLYPAVLRFHVLADSNEEEAQELKLLVRDEIGRAHV